MDIVADLYIRHLLLLASEVQSLAHCCGRDSIEIQDITQGLVDVGMLKPVDILDCYEQHDTANKAANNFLLWVVGHVPENARNVSKVNAAMLENRKGLSVIPEYSQAKLETPEVDEDWLQFLMRRGKKPNEETFKNSLLNPGYLPKSDATVSGAAPPELSEKLPGANSYKNESFNEL